MEEKEIEALVEKLLAPTVDSLLGEVRTFMEGNIGKLNQRLESLEKSGSEQPEGKPKGKAESVMEQRIKALEEQLKAAEDARVAQEKAASAMRFDSELSKILDSKTPLHKGIVQELLANRLKQDAVEKDGAWLTKDGKTLAESAEAFFNTPEGSHFLPSQHRDGAGTKEGSKVSTASSTSLANELAQAFLA